MNMSDEAKRIMLRFFLKHSIPKLLKERRENEQLNHNRCKND